MGSLKVILGRLSLDNSDTYITLLKRLKRVFHVFDGVSRDDRKKGFARCWLGGYLDGYIGVCRR